MREDILNYLQKDLYQRCSRPTNAFGMGLYDHIVSVVENAELLAEHYGADKEIVMIAAWLHDIASATDYSLYPEHHIHGARMAGDILTAFGYEEERIRRVQDCILHHRGSVVKEKHSPEEICVADADAISHFDNVPSLLYMAYVAKGMGIEEGKSFVRGKLNRSYGKLSGASRNYYQGKYRQVIAVLS